MAIHGGFPISMAARFLPISWSSSRQGPRHVASLDNCLYTDNRALGATSPSIRHDWKVVATTSRLESLQSLNGEEEDQDMERMAEHWVPSVCPIRPSREESPCANCCTLEELWWRTLLFLHSSPRRRERTDIQIFKWICENRDLVSSLFHPLRQWRNSLLFLITGHGEDATQYITNEPHAQAWRNPMADMHCQLNTGGHHH
jgi:hypothetical protein